MRVLQILVMFSIGAVTGVLAVDMADHSRTERFIREMEEHCIPRPGEKALLTNEANQVRCQRERMLPMEGRRYPWGR